MARSEQAERWVRVDLQAKLLTDAHLGSGSGGGGIDALVARDRAGHPVIWASHVEGVLRDVERRLHGDAAAQAFFGRAGGQRQRAIFTSLYLESAPPASRIWRSTARTAFDNRAPKDDTLRVVEHVPQGTTFVGQVELPEGDLPTLERLVRAVDALGRGRASGSGQVELKIERRAPAAQARQTLGSSQERLVLLLESQEPVCIKATATPDNLIPSLAFVPGRTLLGALVSWLLGAGHKEVAKLLTSGRAAVGDALPVPSAPARLEVAEVLPAPLSLKSEKPPGSIGAVPWWALAATPPARVDGGEPEAKSGPRLKRPEDDLFVYRASPGEAWQTFRPLRQVRLRNGRPDPDQPDPSLFAIEQIAEKTLFLAELRGEPSEMAKLASSLGEVLSGRRWLRVGGGGAPVQVRAHTWSAPAAPIEVGTQAYLTLTSDLLVRDELLRWRTCLDEAAWCQLEGWPATVQIRPVAQMSTPVHGFNGTSRLWRTPAAAIRRGSVFRVEGVGVAALAEWAAAGEWPGERTHEGFGRFRLDVILPGVGCEAAREAVVVDDAPDEAVAKATRNWWESNKILATPGPASDRRPSLSQWFDLVAELERGEQGVATRLTPTTAGGRAWSHPNARAILKKIEALRPAERAANARMFVRWLRSGRTER